MSTNPTTIGGAADNTGRSRTAARGQGRRYASLAGAAVALLALAALGLYQFGEPGLFGGADPTNPVNPQTFTVERRDLLVTVDQPGTIEAREKHIVKSQVKGRVEVAWIIDEGAAVGKDELIVRLDDTDLQDQKTDQQQKVDNADSALVAAEVALQNTRSQADSDTAKAELDVEFAKLALRKYLEGEYPQQLKAARADVEIARETYKRESDRAEWSKKLLEKGFVTESEADADAAAANKAKLDLEIAEGELRLLKDFTYKQKKRELESDVQQAEAELARVRNKAKADIEKANVELRTADNNLKRAERELEDIQKDIDHCEIEAPVAGRVVYAPQGRRGRGEPVEEGDEVRLGQELIHLPDTSTMGAAVKIEEARRGKVELGMPVLITGANLPDAGLRGKLTRIATYLDPSGWWNNDRKVYSADVQITEPAELRTGMNVKTRIIAARLQNVIVVPLQSVVVHHDRHVVYVQAAPGRFEPRPVTIGEDDGALVHIRQGLDVGQVVSQTPPLEPDGEEPAAGPPPEPEPDRDGEADAA